MRADKSFFLNSNTILVRLLQWAGFSMLLALTRLVFIPMSDYPDISVVAESFASGYFGIFSEMDNPGQLADSCVTPGPPASFIYGGRYVCNAVIGQDLLYPYFLALISLYIVFLSLIGLWVAKIASSRDLNRYFSTIYLVSLSPSTFYYVLAPHTDALYSLLALVLSLLIIFIYKHSFGRLLGKASLLASSRFVLPYFYSLVSILIPSLLIFDSQFVIVALFVAFAFLVLDTSFSILIQRVLCVFRSQATFFLAAKPLLSRRAIVFSLSAAAFVFLIYVSNAALLKLLALLPLGQISFVASSYTTTYLDILHKYPLPFRIFNFAQGFLVRTPAGYGISIVTFFLFCTVFLAALLRQFARFDELQPKASQVVSILSLSFLVVIPTVIAILPGYSNYKYWLFLTPIICYVLSNAPRCAFLVLVLVQFELLANAILLI
jgi:hypothetical protein